MMQHTMMLHDWHTHTCTHTNTRLWIDVFTSIHLNMCTSPLYQNNVRIIFFIFTLLVNISQRYCFKFGAFIFSKYYADIDKKSFVN